MIMNVYFVRKVFIILTYHEDDRHLALKLQWKFHGMIYTYFENRILEVYI